MDEKISKLFLPLLEKLYNQDPAGEPFRKPVDVVKYRVPDYYKLIHHPIDLTTIRQRLENHEYQGDAWRFIADMQLLFANAYIFNKRGTVVYDFTNKLNKIWTNESPNIMQKLNYCCGNSYKFGPQLLYCYGSTFEKYCQISVGAKYRCYQDQYSFCLNCFNKIDSDHIDLRKLSSCETARVSSSKPVPKDDFKECTNDDWQYEVFIQCTQCSRRVHQICELYPARVDQIQACVQQLRLEDDQRELSQVPPEELDRIARTEAEISTNDISSLGSSSTTVETSDINNEHGGQEHQEKTDEEHPKEPLCCEHPKETEKDSKETKDKNNDNEHSLSHDIPDEHEPAKPLINQVSELASQQSNNLNKDAQTATNSLVLSDEKPNEYRDKFVCNYCYRKKRIGFNLRHRKYSARRIPHTRMSRYIETKVNEYIKENAPAAGEVTVRVLTAYRDEITVKPEMQKFINMSRENGTDHPFLKDFPKEFNYTNRAIFAWQEIDGVDVCVFGMHVQEYGDDCPEPNRQVVYLSYLDSVHFFRPKSVRTSVYHEILLSYFKYVRRLGFKRIFIWVCPSRKGDDYIFYRHPSEQKMPNQRRLADWYINLLDKGIMNGIIDRHETLFQFFSNSGNNSILSMPYLNGDFWPGEFERLLKTMIESQREFDMKFISERKDSDDRSSESTMTSIYSNLSNFSSVKEQKSSITKITNNITTMDNRSGDIISHNVLSMIMGKPSPMSNSPGFVDMNGSYIDFQQESCSYNGDSMNSLFDQPLDLSAKASAEQSPATCYNDFDSSDMSFGINNPCQSLNNIPTKKRKRKNTSTMGYTKKRNRAASSQASKQQKTSSALFDLKNFKRQNQTRSNLTRACTQLVKESSRTTPDVTLTPHEIMLRELDKSLKRQKDGFMVARLSDCECSPHFESQRRQDETLFTCNLMKGREPFLQLARTMNYEFSTLRRAKFSSLAMVKHLGRSFKLEPLCHDCFSFDSSKCHYACNVCDDFYLCTSCYDHVSHDHQMTLLEPKKQPDITDFLEDCSNSSQSDSISSASSTISNKSFSDNSIDIPSNLDKKTTQRNTINSGANEIKPPTLETKNPISTNSNNKPPLSCHNQRKKDLEIVARLGDEENARLSNYDTGKLTSLPNAVQVAGNQSPEIMTNRSDQSYLDINLVDNFIRQAEIAYDVDFEDLRDESKELLSHYYSCSDRDTCYRCRFVILSCSFMGIVMRSSRNSLTNSSSASQSATLAHSQSTKNNNNNTTIPNNNNNNNAIGINLSKRHEFTHGQNHHQHHQPRQK